MKKEDISEALNDVDFDMVEDAYEKAEKKKKNPWLKWGALAASLLLIIGAAIVFSMQQPNVPIWDASHFPAEKVISLSSNTLGGSGTTAYTTVYASDSEYLPLNPIPWGRYLNIYEHTDITEPKNKAQLQEFADATLPKLTKALGIAHTEYSKKNNTIIAGIAPYNIHIVQRSTETQLSISSSTDRDSIVLNGTPLQIDLRLSNKEILESLEPIKKSLFEIFDVSFSDVKILRNYGIKIYFYNESAHYLNKVNDTPISDCICISYRPISDEYTTIRYTKVRVDLDARYPLVARAKKLSLKDAEELLRKGYVFGGGCCLCTKEKEEVVFDSYDFVSLEYYWFTPKNTEEDVALGIPVYAFYKEISKGRYAKTYVPAIEIEGYEEYIDEIHRFHASRANRS